MICTDRSNLSGPVFHPELLLNNVQYNNSWWSSEMVSFEFGSLYTMIQMDINVMVYEVPFNHLFTVVTVLFDRNWLHFEVEK